MMKSSGNGFTLVELLVVIVVMGALGFLFTDIMTQTMRGQNKAKIINQVKQNGQTVLDKLITDIRQAQEIKCTSDDGNTIIYTKLTSGETGFTRIIFTPPAVHANGMLVLDHPIMVSDPRTGADPYNPCAEILVTDNNPQYLTDTDPVNGVSIDNTTEGGTPFQVFSHTLASGSTNPGDTLSDTVTINFNITAGVDAGFGYETTVKEGSTNYGGIHYSTTVQPRGLR